MCTSRPQTVFIDASPGFFDMLERLAGGGLNRQEKMTVILIRCGVTPTQMGYIFRRKKGSISSRREQLGKRLFGRIPNPPLPTHLFPLRIFLSILKYHN